MPIDSVTLSDKRGPGERALTRLIVMVAYGAQLARERGYARTAVMDGTLFERLRPAWAEGLIQAYHLKRWSIATTPQERVNASQRRKRFQCVRYREAEIYAALADCRPV